MTSERAPATTAWSIGVNSLSLGNAGGTLPGLLNFDYNAPSPTEFAYYASKGLKTIRLPLIWERLQPTLDGPLDADYLGLVQTALTEAGAAGLSVILDCHNYCRYLIDGTEHVIGDGTLTGAHLGNLWTAMAAALVAFKGSDALAGFDIQNEPHDMPTPQSWPQAAQAVITAVRGAGWIKPLFIEGDGWSGASTWPAINDGLKNLVDPADALIYSAHAYMDGDGSGTHGDYAATLAAGNGPAIGATRLAPFLAWGKANGKRLQVGELGLFNIDSSGTGGGAQANLAALAALQGAGCPVTLWDAGAWESQAPWTLEQKSDGTDTVAMQAVCHFTGAAYKS